MVIHDDKPGIEAGMTTAEDRAENVSLMEPLLIGGGSRHHPELTDLAVELAQKSAGLRRSLPDSLLGSLGELVRAMNCYYSNLIEGHDTHPTDIERALKGDYNEDPAKRDLQLEAKAHIAVQLWIDTGGLQSPATTTESITEIHHRFCKLLPEDLLWVEDPATKERIEVIPGALRHRDVRVGRHIPVGAPAVPRFLKRYEEAYARLGKTETIIATAAAHHRLAWIHPFVDGNGRVARLVSHATLLDALDTGALWSIARGLARNASEYKRHLAACDLPRRNDLDGRGNLSEENLAEFTKFFLTVCIDQVSFMERLMQPRQLRTRILGWAEEEIRLRRLPPKAGGILEALLYRGELPRGDAAAIVGTGERQARRVVSALLECGAVCSGSTRAPLRLAFPAALSARWMPGLFPERAG
jgi:Fic family protein